MNTAAAQIHRLQNPIRVEGDTVSFTSLGEARTFPLVPLPDRMLDWMEQGRRNTYDKLLQKGGGSVPFASHHLPVVVTWSEGQGFPFNCSNKGVGHLPKPEYLKEYTEKLQSVLASTAGRPWEESMRERIAAVSSFYFNRKAIDSRCLTTLEIFEKNTYHNLTRNPIAAIHYTGNSPDFMSFQVNCAVEVIGPDDPRHTFIQSVRVMFEFNDFHIAQEEFPYAYLLWITSVQDKTPFRVPEKSDKFIPIKALGGLEWDPDAIESVQRAPGMIRQFITEQIEKYARQRGFTRVDMKLIREAREVLERPRREKAKEEEESKPVITQDKQEAEGAALDKIDRSYRCPACGFLHHGNRPEKCPVCGRGGEMFRVESHEVKWTEEALARLGKVPEGFMRQATKSAVEKFAQENGHGAISLEVVEGGLVKAREMMREAMEGKA